jgi:hypothetical protein
MNRKRTSTVALVAMTATMLFTPFTASTGGPVAPAGEQRTLAMTLGAPFHDHAILQREMKVPIWGWSEPGSKVTVEFAGQKKNGKAGKDGRWMVRLDELKANFDPAEMVISEKGGKTETLKNILVGEVWMASGQSNMQWVAAGRGCVVGKVLIPNILKRVEAGKEKYPVIREFGVSSVVAMMHPIEKAEGAWKKGDDFMNYSAIAFAFAYKLFQELDVPIGILNCSFSQTSIQSWVPREGFRDGKDEYTQGIYKQILETDPTTPEYKAAWNGFYKSLEDQLAANKKSRSPKAVNAPTPGNTQSNRDASWLFNGKLSPVVTYAIRGAIWNQGYANSNEGLVYYNNLHSLIRGWRMVFDRPELPVYFHQWYTPGKGSDKPAIDAAAEMRLGTQMARDIPHTGMASQIDIGGTIHYQHKAVPGQRLALHALKNQYRKRVVTDGPMFKSYTVKGNQLIVEFDHADGGLVVAEAQTNAYGKNVAGEPVEGATGLADPRVIKNGEDQVKLVYLADENRVWHLATIKISGNKLIATSDAVKNPRGISYATGGVAFRPSLYNKALLPTTPFIYYDNKVVLAKNWPDEKLKVAGETIDPNSVGKIYEWRKFPILSTQFRDNAVLQAGKPLTFWGSTQLYGESGSAADGKLVIYFDFNGIKKTVTVTPAMPEWQVTLPAMKASADPHTLKVSATLDGELVHEREITGMVLGEVFYVAGAGGRLTVPKVNASGQIVRALERKCRRSTSPRPSRFSVAVSRTPKNRYASQWVDAKRGTAVALGNAIAAKTGTPVGIIYMTGRDAEELKNWVPYTALSQTSSWKEDYSLIGAKYPDTPYYAKNIQRYMGDWKAYWEKDIASMIATRAVPEGWGAWGEMPSTAFSGSSTACQSYNILTHSFFPTSLRGVIFLAGPAMAEADQGANFGPEISALANSWKQGFALQKGEDVPFFYTMPTGPKVTKPAKIKGRAEVLEGGDWSPIEEVVK